MRSVDERSRALFWQASCYSSPDGQVSHRYTEWYIMESGGRYYVCMFNIIMIASIFYQLNKS